MSQGQRKTRDTRTDKNTHPSHHTEKKAHHRNSHTSTHMPHSNDFTSIDTTSISSVFNKKKERLRRRQYQEKGARSSASARCTTGCALRQRFRRDYNAAASPPSVLLRHSSLSILPYSCCTPHCSLWYCTQGHICTSAVYKECVSAHATVCKLLRF